MAGEIKEVHGDQGLVHYCYNIALQGDKPAKSYPIERLNTHDELAKEHGTSVEELISVLLVDGNLGHIV